MYTPEEQKQHRVALISALRSGQYTQRRGALLRNGKHCCLGVACEIYQQDIGDLVVESLTGRLETTFNGMTGVLPLPCQEYFGMSDSGRVGYAEHTLMTLNDHHYWTFEQIADYLENYDAGVSVIMD